MIDKKVTISSQMFLLGNKFAQLANEADSVRGAKAAFEMAVKAYGLCLQAEDKLGPKIVDGNLMFLAGVKEKILRPTLWAQYLTHCSRFGISALSKKEFFAYCNRMGFTFQRGGGGVFCLPPLREVRADLRSARALLREEHASLLEDGENKQISFD